MQVFRLTHSLLAPIDLKRLDSIPVSSNDVAGNPQMPFSSGVKNRSNANEEVNKSKYLRLSIEKKRMDEDGGRKKPAGV